MYHLHFSVAKNINKLNINKLWFRESNRINKKFKTYGLFFTLSSHKKELIKSIKFNVSWSNSNNINTNNDSNINNN